MGPYVVYKYLIELLSRDVDRVLEGIMEEIISEF